MSYKSDFLNELAAKSTRYRREIAEMVNMGFTEAEIETKISDTFISLQEIVQAGVTGLPETLMNYIKPTVDIATGKWTGIEIPEPIKKIVSAATELIKLGLADTWNQSLILATATNLGAVGLLAGSVILSAGTFGLATDAIDEVWRVPVVDSGMAIAKDIQETPYNYGWKITNQRHWLSANTPMLPEAYRLALASSKGIMNSEAYIKGMAENGLNSEWADIYKEQNYQYPNFGMALELLWRGVIDDNIFNLWMQRNGFPNGTIENIKALRENIPPSQDLVTMVVREAFDPKYVTEAPDVFAKYMAMKGFSKDWSDRYWTMHWTPIPLTQAYSNLWRGYWTKEQFLEALRIADMHPMWREDIYNVAYQPPSLREMGYGWDTGIYKEADIKKFKRWVGLSEKDADAAAKSMVAYRTEAEREAVRREHLHLFATGKETENEFKANLTRLITATEAIELWVERGQMQAIKALKPEIDTEYKIITSTEAIWAFKNGIFDETTLRSALALLDWTKERIDLSVARAKYELDLEKIKEAVVTYKQLTISQITDLYNIGEITIEELQALFEGMGYTEADAINLINIITYKPVIDEKIKTWTRADIQEMYKLHVLDEQEMYDEIVALGYDDVHASGLALEIRIAVNYPDLKVMYSNGWISADDLYNELLRLGLPETRANELMLTIVKSEQPARLATERDLTKAEIIKGVKNNILDTTQAVSLLMDLGYDDSEAIYLLMINKVVEAGDPESYFEMKQVTNAYKTATGIKVKPIPPEALILEKKIKELKTTLADMITAAASDEAVAEQNLKILEAEALLRKVLTVTEATS